MKFTDGQWLHQPGIKAHYPAEAYDVTEANDGLVIHAPTQPINHRGDTLQGPLLTVTLNSPMEGVVRVRIEHYVGGNKDGAVIPLQKEGNIPVAIEKGEAATTLTSGSLTAKVSTKDGWGISFESEGKVLTQSGWRAMGYVQSSEGETFVHDQLALGVGENVYGLGERFTAFVKNGQVVETVNKDGGTGCEQAYKSVPFYLTNRGYGVLVNETGPVSFEVASEKVSRVQFSIPGESLEYFVIAGPSPKDVLGRLTELTGRPALPPTWSFGLWLSTSFTTNYDEETCNTFIDGMRDRDLPLHVFHFDCFWMREFDWCNFEWDPRVFPDPEGMLSRFHDRGLKICVWINSYIGQRSKLFAEGAEKGYFIKRTDGSVWQTDLWQPGMAIVDFTNPEAAEWYAGKLKGLLKMGVDALKTDFGERIPTEGVVYHDGSDPVKMRNLYTIQYNECVFNAVKEVRGEGEAVLFARSAYASGQRFPAHWGGDCWSTFESMAESLRGGLSLSLCGFGFWSHDIGGFEGTAPSCIYKRWAAFGLLSSHSRLHGSSSYRVPWAYDEEACDVLRVFTKLKCSIMPYLWAAAVEAHRDGIPTMRAMMLEFPEDPACDSLDAQYCLGGSLIVAPVFTEDGSVSYYLPKGQWTHLMTGEVKDGGSWYQEKHDFLSLPLYVRPNTLLPIGTHDDHPDYKYNEGVTLKLFQLDEGASASCTLFGKDGKETATITATRSAGKVSLSIEGELKDAKLEIVGGETASIPAGANSLELDI
ncbi:alpha-xylosidase [Pelagicoccus albus]|uniref:alpha-D-xyloside xylohydrolase n=1 Tax=Pelagicoccus albus TaxID=415222 RepID=A0A7X1E783_9BACT|nr:alpha-xylosidase [Pelagicoccus albus]MBC2605465.1 alpha-xylosidase [Pelagicoccus albus]